MTSGEKDLDLKFRWLGSRMREPVHKSLGGEGNLSFQKALARNWKERLKLTSFSISGRIGVEGVLIVLMEVRGKVGAELGVLSAFRNS